MADDQQIFLTEWNRRLFTIPTDTQPASVLNADYLAAIDVNLEQFATAIIAYVNAPDNAAKAFHQNTINDWLRWSVQSPLLIDGMLAQTHAVLTTATDEQERHALYDCLNIATQALDKLDIFKVYCMEAMSHGMLYPDDFPEHRDYLVNLRRGGARVPNEEAILTRNEAHQHLRAIEAEWQDIRGGRTDGQYLTAFSDDNWDWTYATARAARHTKDRIATTTYGWDSIAKLYIDTGCNEDIMAHLCQEAAGIAAHTPAIRMASYENREAPGRETAQQMLTQAAQRTRQALAALSPLVEERAAAIHRAGGIQVAMNAESTGSAVIRTPTYAENSMGDSNYLVHVGFRGHPLDELIYCHEIGHLGHTPAGALVKSTAHAEFLSTLTEELVFQRMLADAQTPARELSVRQAKHALDRWHVVDGACYYDFNRQLQEGAPLADLFAHMEERYFRHAPHDQSVAIAYDALASNLNGVMSADVQDVVTTASYLPAKLASKGLYHLAMDAGQTTREFGAALEPFLRDAQATQFFDFPAFTEELARGLLGRNVRFKEIVARGSQAMIENGQKISALAHAAGVDETSPALSKEPVEDYARRQTVRSTIQGVWK